MKGVEDRPITDSYLAPLSPEQLAFRRQQGSSPDDVRCRFDAAPGEPAICEHEALYAWHATCSDTSGRPGWDWHYELYEQVCGRHGAEREVRLF